MCQVGWLRFREEKALEVVADHSVIVAAVCHEEPERLAADEAGLLLLSGKKVVARLQQGVHPQRAVVVLLKAVGLFEQGRRVGPCLVGGEPFSTQREGAQTGEPE